MKKKTLIVTVVCAILFVVTPTAAAEVGSDIQVQNEQADVGIAPCADEIVTQFRVHNNKVQYRRWNQTRGYWVDKKWITLK